MTASGAARACVGRRLTSLAVAAIAAACSGTPEPRPPATETPPIVAPAPPPRSPAVRAHGLALPGRPGSVKFAVIGDAGRASRPQYDVAEQMIGFRALFPYDFVLMAGDNVYDGGMPEDYRQKFELPYKPLLDEGVRFYAAIGNHDDPNQPLYAPFNMGGQRYYTFKKEGLGGLGTAVRFFMLDTELLDEAQLAWLAREAGSAREPWKICVFHRPIYTSGQYARPAVLLRRLLEPVILETGVSAVFSGHEHFYERIVPQHGVAYFISGGAGSLRRGVIRKTPLTAASFDRDFHFMLVEITGDELHFQAISRTGDTIDAGIVRRREPTP
jgi:calcineurin-like phosphoesterase family protein